MKVLGFSPKFVNNSPSALAFKASVHDNLPLLISSELSDEETKYSNQRSIPVPTSSYYSVLTRDARKLIEERLNATFARKLMDRTHTIRKS
jgi:hypothetical protein